MEQVALQNGDMCESDKSEFDRKTDSQPPPG